VLVELTMTEQRYRAVLEVQAGASVTEVAERFGVSRQAVRADVRIRLGRQHSHVQHLEASMLAACGPAPAEHAEHAGP
jgi:predicted ArsR family transcriptional regulator